MPAASQMPPSLERLARLNAIELNDRRWKSDLERLTQFLRGAVDVERIAYPPQNPTDPGPHPIPAVIGGTAFVHRPKSDAPSAFGSGFDRQAIGVDGMVRRASAVVNLRARHVRAIPASRSAAC